MFCVRSRDGGLIFRDGIGWVRGLFISASRGTVIRGETHGPPLWGLCFRRSIVNFFPSDPSQFSWERGSVVILGPRKPVFLVLPPIIQILDWVGFPIAETNPLRISNLLWDILPWVLLPSSFPSFSLSPTGSFTPILSLARLLAHSLARSCHFQFFFFFFSFAPVYNYV